MKTMRMIRIAALLMCLGATVFTYAQERQEEEKQPQREEQAKPERQEDRAKPEKRDEAKPERQEDRARTERQDERSQPGKQEERTEREKHGDQARPVDHGRGEQQMQGRGKGGRIPEEKFRASFGKQHTFRISRPTVVEGQPQFQYAGYSFVIVDPWPAEWQYTDDVYVDYIDDQYYLFDLMHPGVSIVINVVM